MSVIFRQPLCFSQWDQAGNLAQAFVDAKYNDQRHKHMTPNLVGLVTHDTLTLDQTDPPFGMVDPQSINLSTHPKH